MGTTVAKLTAEKLSLKGELDERMPAVTSGLVSFYPLDSAAGTFDKIGGYQPTQHTCSGANLIEAMRLNWRDPASWSIPSGLSWDETKQALKIVGYHNMWLLTPIVVDTTKHYQISIEVMEEEQSSTGLYLGGLCNNAVGERVTTNYDYSYGANAQPTTGVWTTYRVTRYGTGVITSNTSTSFNTVVGWTGDRGVSDKLTKRYYYGGLFNYSSGGVMYIRNLSIVVTDADNSNAMVAQEGLHMDIPTTNLETSPVELTAYNFQWATEEVVEFQGRKCLKIDVNCPGGQTGWVGSYSGKSPTSIVKGEKWTRSVEYYVPESEYPQSGFPRLSAEGNWSSTGNKIYDVTKKGTWQKLFNPCTVGSSGGGAAIYLYLFAKSANSTEDVKYTLYLYHPQFEKLAHFTSFVNGSRSTSPTFQINIDRGVNDFTLVSEFIPNADSDTLANGCSFFDFGGGYRIITYSGIPYLNGNAITGLSGNNVHLDFNTIPTRASCEHHYTEWQHVLMADRFGCWAGCNVVKDA
jgi:hypothetical protein